MPDFLSIEELIIDDSFHNYCFQKNEADILYWQRFIKDYPSQKEKIEEAKKIVLGIHVMLQEKHTGEETKTNLIGIENKSGAKIISFKKVLRYSVAVAAVLIVVLFSRKLINVSHNTATEVKDQVASNTIPHEIFFKTANGEKKMIVLSDSTKIWLNAASELRVEKGFGIHSRNVYLSGEALFEVTHDELLPFVVHTDEYSVKDLGTVFNVKAYPGDKQSETSLIKGKVEIQIDNNTRKIFLSPSQKAVINNGDVEIKGKEVSAKSLNTQVAVLPLSYDVKDSAVIETAWAQNRLEINNENFYEIKEKLQRWFGVKINISDEEVGKYTFTATFEKENIQQVLQALQYAYHFNYKIENNDITISK